MTKLFLRFRWSAPLAVLVIVTTGKVCQAAAPVPSFEGDVLPLLEARCTQCHGEAKQENKLDVRSMSTLLKGGKTGAAVRPGSLRDSLLWNFVATGKMPATKEKLSDNEKDLLRRWIVAGAPTAAQVSQRGAAAKSVVDSVIAGAQHSSNKRGVVAMAALIDTHIDTKLKSHNIVAAELTDDAEFHRRVYLDLTGRIPTLDQTEKFLADTRRDKRALLIDELLASPHFGQHLAVIWHRLTIPKSAGSYRRIPHAQYKKWLAERFNTGRSWGSIVAELLTAEGALPPDKVTANNKAPKRGEVWNPAVAYLAVHNTEGRPQPKGIAASSARLFMAQSIECAQCHNHPLAKWTQEDFWGTAAFFTRIRFPNASSGDASISGNLHEPIMGKELIYNDKGRYTRVPAVPPDATIDMAEAAKVEDEKRVRAKFLDDVTPELEPQQSYRATYAAWMTAPKNVWFAKAAVNRLWSQLLGRGFVEPVDDMAEDNPASHPELLAELAIEFTASGQDFKHVIRCICNSRAYQRSSVPRGDGPAPAEWFPHQQLKQMTAEVLLESLTIALPTFAATRNGDNKNEKNPGLFEQYFFELYDEGDATPAEYTRGLQQALRLMNGDGKLVDRKAIEGIVSSERSVTENIARLYLAALNRPPRAEELARVQKYVDEQTALASANKPDSRGSLKPPEIIDLLADVYWALLNSSEFVFNR